jgi:hypothetical protein
VLAWVPGAALVGLLGITDLLLASVLVVATSVAVETLGSEAMLWLGWWHPRGAVVVLLLGAAALLAAQWVGPRRPSRAS